MRATSKHTMILGIAVALVATACGSAPQTSTKTPTPTVPTSVETPLVASTSTIEVTEDASTYDTKTFNRPFDVTVPTWAQQATPNDEQPNFVTWLASDSDRAVRFLIPVNVYPPGGTGTTPPPKDYLAYLLSQTDHGAHFTDTTQTTVGGRPATIVTATTDNSLDGSLGCPTLAMAADNCFGLQPDYVLRLAVIDTGDKTLLVWLRNRIDDSTTEIESFEKMLTSVQFSDRAVQAPAATTTAPLVATSLDGTYRWTITKDDALAHGLASDKKPENLATMPWVFTMTMNDGTWALGNRDDQGAQEHDGGTYTVDGDQVVFNWNGDLLTFAFNVDGDGTLHLDPQPPMNPGDQFVWGTEPWTKIG